MQVFDEFPEDRRASIARAVRGRTVTYRPGKVYGGPWVASPWNIAQALRYVYRRAAREMFRFRHGPILDGPNSFE